MKNLELKQMENLQGGSCEGQLAAFSAATLSLTYSLLGVIIGFLLATTALAISIYNLEQCKKLASEVS